ncbi:hypothetical protein PIB30_009399 [Stylosanthes scabra]|uniref:Uncharacterized protein n=1 Tax=Stylosanthes scabra TaxID=79078 RepID=A0ABU6W361_9FABA|nr:hypothetical protein [Stylosanthes scabra]
MELSYVGWGVFFVTVMDKNSIALMPRDVEKLNVHRVLPYSIMVALKKNLKISFHSDTVQPSASGHASRRCSNLVQHYIISDHSHGNLLDHSVTASSPSYEMDHESNYSTDEDLIAYLTMTRAGPQDGSDEE